MLHQPVQGILYHSPISNPCGDLVLPLNEMRYLYPGLYRRELAKYRGRMHVVRQPVLPLDCTWADVVFLSPIDSRILFTAIGESGLHIPIMDSWTIDAGKPDPRRTCIRLMRKSGDPIADDYLPFTTATLRAVSQVTDAAVTRLRNLTPDEPLLPWADVPHVLHRGPIPIADFRPADR